MEGPSRPSNLPGLNGKARHHKVDITRNVKLASHQLLQIRNKNCHIFTKTFSKLPFSTYTRFRPSRTHQKCMERIGTRTNRWSPSPKSTSTICSDLNAVLPNLHTSQPKTNMMQIKTQTPQIQAHHGPHLFSYGHRQHAVRQQSRGRKLTKQTPFLCHRY